MRRKGLQDGRKEDSQKRRVMGLGQMGFPTCVSRLVLLRLLETGKRVKTLRGDLIENYKGARQNCCHVISD